MADKRSKFIDNVPGKIYIDDACIDCSLCRDLAPRNFRRNEDEGYSYVFKQPENDEERQECQEAIDSCPVEAIGDDGDESQPLETLAADSLPAPEKAGYLSDHRRATFE